MGSIETDLALSELAASSDQLDRAAGAAAAQDEADARCQAAWEAVREALARRGRALECLAASSGDNDLPRVRDALLAARQRGEAVAELLRGRRHEMAGEWVRLKHLLAALGAPEAELRDAVDCRG